MIGCTCPVCTSTDPRNHRLRCSVLIRSAGGNLLIDTTPDLRTQLLRAKVHVIHALLYTHAHADHMMGMDDLRVVPRFLQAPLPCYCNAEVESALRRTFPYVFDPELERLPFGLLPRLDMRRIDREPFAALDHEVTPIPLWHGRMGVLGFRFGDLAYCTDTCRIPDNSWPLLQGVQTLILDCLRLKPHSTHFCLPEALDVIARLKPKRAYLTHLAHEIDHEAISAQLPSGVELAYDGLSIEF